jgi:hypothetical protein
MKIDTVARGVMQSHMENTAALKEHSETIADQGNTIASHAKTIRRLWRDHFRAGRYH